MRLQCWLKMIGLMICMLSPMVAASAGAVGQEEPPNEKWRLSALTFEGLKTKSPDKIVQASGLKVGETVDIAMIKAATVKLAQTGYFGTVKYHYRRTKSQIELTFELEEISDKPPAK